MKNLKETTFVETNKVLKLKTSKYTYLSNFDVLNKVF